MAKQGSRPLRVFVSYTAELADYPPGHSFVDAACAGIRRVDAIPVTMTDFGARQHIPADVCRSEVLGCDVHMSLIGFRYGSLVPERGDGLSYTEFEFDVATAAGLPRLVFLIDERTPLPPALIDYDRSQINRFRRRVREGMDHLVTGIAVDPGRLEAAVTQALVRIGRQEQRVDVGRPSTVDQPPDRALSRERPDEDLGLGSLVGLLARYFHVDAELIDRQHAAGILRGLEGTAYTSLASLEDALTRTTNRRRKYFGPRRGTIGVSEELAVALAIMEPSCRIGDWAWGWEHRSLERLEALAREEE